MIFRCGAISFVIASVYVIYGHILKLLKECNPERENEGIRNG